MTATFAFIFPGQGSQSVGMLDAWGDHPAVRRTLEEASQALGEDVAKLIREGPKETLELTTNTQPVMLQVGQAWAMTKVAWNVISSDTGDALLPTSRSLNGTRFRPRYTHTTLWSVRTFATRNAGSEPDLFPTRVPSWTAE